MRGTRVSVAVCLVALLAGCSATSPGGHVHGDAGAGKPPPLFDDLGTYHHPITTAVPDAQRYFDQGLRLTYGFNHDEAIRAFREAIRLDPTCAMAHWGVALALGPNYNLPIDPEREQTALAAVATAQRLAANATPAERDYIAALATRYRVPPPADRRDLDRAYAGAMRALAARYPDDDDAGTLFAESLMVLRPWDLWSPTGEPRPDTPEIVATLERVLRHNPNHPGANHYYIHTIEASPHPELGLAAAERLATLVPGAGHLVHMPSHIYMRVGRYADASEANRRAAAVDQAYISREQPAGVYPMMYYPHNLHFLSASAAMEGRAEDAIDAARQVSAMAPPEMVREMAMIEYFSPTAWFALARFGRWDELLREPEPPASFAYLHAMWRYTRGLAQVHAGRFDDAAAAVAEIDAAVAATPADRIVADNQPAVRHLQLAGHVLAGRLAVARGDVDAGIAHLRAAIAIEDALPYTEPPPWYHPVRLMLGDVLSAHGRWHEAATAYRDDLSHNRESGWALAGLASSLRALHDRGASPAQRRFEKAWTRATVPPDVSR